MDVFEAVEQPELWKKLRIAVVGGDDREQEIARLAATTGAGVTAFGFPWPEAGIEGVTPAASAAEAMQRADIALMPIPGIATDGSLFATETIIPDAGLLSVMVPGAHIILGQADANLRSAAAATGITLHEYESDQELMLLRAPAIVEAALRLIIENTRITIHKSRICVVGQGNIGGVLTRSLIGLGAEVTVAARNPVQRAQAYTLGAEAVTIDGLAERAPDFPMLLSTVPARVVTAAVIERLPADALIMDLSAPPGGVDLDYARRSGRTAIWARALGRRAPITVGASQWSGILRIINAILAGGRA
jgi:dipicolinate synthase subunit A